MKPIAVILIVVASTATFGQVKHAPTVAHCQADQRLWLSKIEAASTEEASSTLPKYAVLKDWAGEMEDCEDVDPDNKAKYYNTGSEVHAEIATRMLNFLKSRTVGQVQGRRCSGQAIVTRQTYVLK